MIIADLFIWGPPVPYPDGVLIPPEDNIPRTCLNLSLLVHTSIVKRAVGLKCLGFEVDLCLFTHARHFVAVDLVLDLTVFFAGLIDYVFYYFSVTQLRRNRLQHISRSPRFNLLLRMQTSYNWFITSRKQMYIFCMNLSHL